MGHLNYLQEADQRHAKTYLWANNLNESFKLLSGLRRDHRRRETIAQWDSPGEEGLFQGTTISKLSSVP